MAYIPNNIYTMDSLFIIKQATAAAGIYALLNASAMRFLKQYRRLLSTAQLPKLYNHTAVSVWLIYV